DTTDRYLAAFLADRVGAEFGGRISGVQKFGLFVKLDETGADALVPVRSLGAEFFRYDAGEQSLTGSDSGVVIRPGQRVTVQLAEGPRVSGGWVRNRATRAAGACPGRAARAAARRRAARRPGPRRPRRRASARRGGSDTRRPAARSRRSQPGPDVP